VFKILILVCDKTTLFFVVTYASYGFIWVMVMVNSLDETQCMKKIQLSATWGFENRGRYFHWA